MRSRLVRSVLLAALITVALAAGIWALWESPPRRLLYTEARPGGRVFQCFSDGSATLGRAGSTVEGRHTKQLPGAGSSDLAVSPPALTEEEIRQAAEEYRKSGRTIEKDEAEFERLTAECDRRR